MEEIPQGRVGSDTGTQGSVLHLGLALGLDDRGVALRLLEGGGRGQGRVGLRVREEESRLESIVGVAIRFNSVVVGNVSIVTLLVLLCTAVAGYDAPVELVALCRALPVGRLRRHEGVDRRLGD